MAYGNDTTAPVVDTVVEADGITPVYSVRFKSNEASSIYYTTDGSTPTTASTEWKPPRARALPLPLQLAPGTNLKWIATDFKGNVSAVKAQVLGRTDAPGTAGGTVPATLSLSLGAPAQFGAFTPGVTRTYLASTTATVISTAGDATLSVADPSSTNTGKLVNGTFALPQTLQARAPQRRQHHHDVRQRRLLGRAAEPADVLRRRSPTTPWRCEFSQLINSTDALRTGAYSKTLTFTLSTTTP